MSELEYVTQCIHAQVERMSLRGELAPLKRLKELADYLECERAESELRARLATGRLRPAASPSLDPVPPHGSKLFAGGLVAGARAPALPSLDPIPPHDGTRRRPT